jgi:hypothetical protein
MMDAGPALSKSMVNSLGRNGSALFVLVGNHESLAQRFPLK